MTFHLEGFRDVEKALEEIAKKSTQVSVMRRSVQKAAEPMRARAEQYARIDQGDLSQGIRISARAAGEVGRAAYGAVMRHTSGDKVAALAAMRTARRTFKAINPPAIMYLGPIKDLFYAKFVEFGTKAHKTGGKFPGAQHPGSAPDPFMRPAFDAEAERTVERLAPILWAEIQKTAIRSARRGGGHGN